MKRKQCFLLIGSILLLEGLIIFTLSNIAADKLSANEIAKKEKTSISSNPAYQNREQKAFRIYQKNKNTLILVNAGNSLKRSYHTDLRPICKGRLYVSQKLYKHLVDMLADAGEQGHHYWIASAYRSRQKQQQLVDEDVQNAMKKGLSHEEAQKDTYRETMPAGHSEHETGLALDILCAENNHMNTSQEKEAGNIWLRNNCHRYGFILRYPKGKESITGIHYEPWHFRYVGKEAAAYMKKHNLTLEEFWAEI